MVMVFARPVVMPAMIVSDVFVAVRIVAWYSRSYSAGPDDSTLLSPVLSSFHA